jgi:hypothetical protein
MATIGKLVVSLSANSAKLVSELRKTRKSVQKWGAGIKSIVSGVAKAFGLIGTALAAISGGSIALIVTKNAEAIKSIDTMARSFGISARSMQEWGAAGRYVGLETDKIGDIFKDVSEKIGEFIATGSGGAKDVFEQLSLNASEFIGLAPDKAILKISAAMEGMTQQKKIFLFESLASDSALLIPLLEGGAAGFRAMADEAARAGVILSDSQVKGVVAFDDALTSLGVVVTGFGRTLTGELAPVFLLLVEKIKSVINEMGGMKKAAQTVAKFFVSSIQSIVKAAGWLSKSFLEVQLIVSKTKNAMMEMFNVARLINPTLRLFTDAYNSKDFADSALNIKAVESKLLEGIPKIDAAVENFFSEISASVGSGNSLDEVVTQMIASGLDGPMLADFLRLKEEESQAVASAAAESQKLATAAAETAKKLDEVTKSKAWKDIFGKEDVTARANQFDTYAKLAKANIESGSKFTGDNIKVLKSILETSTNNGGSGFSTNNLFEKLDLKGMADVIAGLESMAVTNQQAVNQQKAPTSKISIDLTSDTGKVAGEIWGEPEFIRGIEAWNQQYMNNKARAVTQ